MKKKTKNIPKYKFGGEIKAGNIGNIATASNNIFKGIVGIDDNSQWGNTLNAAAVGSDIGGAIVPGWGHLIGGGAGFLAGALKQGDVDDSTGYINYGGILGRSKNSLQQESNRIKTSIQDRNTTQHMRQEYYSNPNNSLNTNIYQKVAEGGIMRKPVDAFVSKGELIYNPVTKKLNKVPGSKSKPNKEDDVYARLSEGDVVISNSPTMLMANGKTPAQNLEGLINSDRNVKVKEAIIKKVVNWQEANKTKPQEYAKFDGGGVAGINKYGYNKNISDFAYWDKDKNEYKKEYLNWVNNLTEQDVRDIESGKYGDMSEYFSKNKGKKLNVATAQKLMTDKKYGNWHKIGQAVVDNKIKNAEPKLAEPWQAKMSISGVGPLWQDMHKSNYPIDYTVTPIDMKLKTLPNPSAADGSRAARKYLSKQNTPNWLDEMYNLLPVIGGLFDKYDWHTESSQITPPRFVPVNADPSPLLRAADESLAMARYNQANISPNTGTGMVYGLQAASNRAKSYADAYQWQQETNNKLIAQNAGIYNDWRKQHDAYATQAIADTRANEGAAQQMKDQARKDRLEFYYGKRNDDMLTAMLKPMFEYGTPDEAYRQIYKRRIV